jgi:hypothetical protein
MSPFAATARSRLPASPICSPKQVLTWIDPTCLCRDLRKRYAHLRSLVVLTNSPGLTWYIDLHEYLAGPITVPSTPHPITGGSVPVTLGHEFSGVVEEVGAGVSRLKVGDCVAVRPNLYDGTCASCLAGWRNCCQNLGFIGYSSE